MRAEASLAMLAAFALSALLTWLAIGYARRRRLIDEPGARRSHGLPTPRGGGIGIVVAVLAFACVPAYFVAGAPRIATLCLIVAIVLVATVGWIDDHRGLSARARLAVHGLAAIVFLLPILYPLVAIPAVVERAFAVTIVQAWTIAVVAVLAIVWSINLHNFMDGINGILAAQAIFVFCALAILCARAHSPLHASQIAVFAAATAGFLPFNFPRARVFMGDVGSGVLGLLIAAAVLWQMGTKDTALASGLILCSAFVVDATCTLLSRMLRGRRWYHAHREHLYQWLARSGGSHARVVALYMTWNIALVAPVVYWINRKTEPEMPTSNMPALQQIVHSDAAAAIAVYVAGVAVWWLGKRHCLRRARRRNAHASA